MRCALSVKYTPDLEDLVCREKEYKMPLLILFLIYYILKWYFGYIGLNKVYYLISSIYIYFS